MRFWGLHKIFIIHPILMGFFSLDSSQWKGPKGQQLRFWGLHQIPFFVQFWWDFFHWIPLNESFQNCSSRFFLSLTVFEVQGAQKGKNAFLEATSDFYFSSNFDGIFFIGFLSKRAFRIVTTDFFYLLPFLRYKGPKGQKCNFQRYIKF